MNLMRPCFVFIAHVFHSCVKVAHSYCLCVNGCIVLASNTQKPKGMTGESVCLIRLLFLSPVRSCCGGGVSGSLEATAALSASMNGSIKETDVMWQPRDTYTYF